eukprot:Skav222083  [mRNA]  locus=scaffold2165:85653:86793:- [translate_table: standard]
MISAKSKGKAQEQRRRDRYFVPVAVAAEIIEQQRQLTEERVTLTAGEPPEVQKRELACACIQAALAPKVATCFKTGLLELGRWAREKEEEKEREKEKEEREKEREKEMEKEREREKAEEERKKVEAEALAEEKRLEQLERFGSTLHSALQHDSQCDNTPRAWATSQKPRRSMAVALSDLGRSRCCRRSARATVLPSSVFGFWEAQRHLMTPPRIMFA